MTSAPLSPLYEPSCPLVGGTNNSTRSEILEIMVFKVIVLQHFLFFMLRMLHIIQFAFFTAPPSQFQIRTLGGNMEEAMHCFSLFIFQKKLKEKKETKMKHEARWGDGGGDLVFNQLLRLDYQVLALFPSSQSSSLSSSLSLGQSRPTAGKA